MEKLLRFFLNVKFCTYMYNSYDKFKIQVIVVKLNILMRDN